VNKVVAMKYKFVVMPTADWFTSVRQYETGLHEFKMDLKTCLVATLKILINNTMNNPQGDLYISKERYHTLLTSHLITEAALNDYAPVAILTEVSTHFYYELMEYFKVNRLDRYQVHHMQFHSWVGEDLVVKIPYQQ
jgi:hypothetical protein